MLGAAAVVSPALADDDDDDDDGAPAISYPYLKGELEIEIQSDNTFEADEKDEEVSESEAEVTLSVGLYFNERFSVNTTLVMEPVKEVESEDSHFENHGIFAEELYGKILSRSRRGVRRQIQRELRQGVGLGAGHLRHGLRRGRL
ncbi:MAG: hypothetical protein NW215_02290 [Hyphomicrobiales bacterium]|nr:hypothetical protein [Hyphomicrobiales bacterium]